jgi:hypothetical protein
MSKSCEAVAAVDESLRCRLLNVAVCSDSSAPAYPVCRRLAARLAAGLAGLLSSTTTNRMKRTTSRILQREPSKRGSLRRADLHGGLPYQDTLREREGWHGRAWQGGRGGRRFRQVHLVRKVNLARQSGHPPFLCIDTEVKPSTSKKAFRLREEGAKAAVSGNSVR